MTAIRRSPHAPGLAIPLYLVFLGALLALAGACRTNTAGTANNLPDGGRDAPSGSDMREGGAPATCQRNLSEKRGAGEACACADECRSGFCAQGVCCNTECDGTCMSCALADSPGLCSFVPQGLAPADPEQCKAEPVTSCGLDGKCDGAGHCRKHPEGTMCMPGTCEGTAVVNGKVCSEGACVAAPPTSCLPYSCDATEGRCFSSCTGPAQCGGGRQCERGSCGEKPLGAACTSATECASKSCADGVCCNLECNGPCVSCNQVGSLGECTAVPAGNPDPHGQCKAEPRQSCGLSGLCNGVGGCSKFAAGTECEPASCTSGSETPMSTCDGEGSCQRATPIPCAPFQCGATACRVSCTTNADCVAPNICDGGSCGKRPLGHACTTGEECQSTFCVDKVCCNDACTGPCASCALNNTRGRCTAVPAGQPDPRKMCVDRGVAMCNTNGRCNGNRGCQTYPANTICRSETCDRATNRETQESTCVGGRCTPPPSTSCAPFRCGVTSCASSCTNDSQCVAPNTCVNGSCGKKLNGQACSAADPAQCASGFCADGVCCESACTASCFSCRLTGMAGRCVAVAAGSNDPKNRCTDQGPASCGTDGVCDGRGACRRYADGTQCTAATCANGVATTAGTCNGAGVCRPGSTSMCAPYVCNTNGSACFNSCVNNSSCAPPNQCVDGRCGKAANGAPCSAANECQSNFCVNNVCCNEACTGQCKSCTMTGAVGTCRNVPAGQPDPTNMCTATPEASCGNDGKCNGSGGCSKWPNTTPCRSQSCPANTTTEVLAARCDGNGACPPMETRSCGNYRCDAAANACRSTCSGDGDCAVGTCNGGSCGLKPPGTVCTVGSECASGNCVDGRCCTANACPSCESCANSAGTCQPIPAGMADSNGTCTDQRASNPCGTTGACDGASGCERVSAGTACGTTCVAGGSESRVCNGNGSCGSQSPPSVMGCGDFACNASTGMCRSSCSDDNHCASGKVCNGGSCGDPPPPMDAGSGD